MLRTNAEMSVLRPQIMLKQKSGRLEHPKWNTSWSTKCMFLLRGYAFANLPEPVGMIVHPSTKSWTQQPCPKRWPILTSTCSSSVLEQVSRWKAGTFPCLDGKFQKKEPLNSYSTSILNPTDWEISWGSSCEMCTGFLSERTKSLYKSTSSARNVI